MRTPGINDGNHQLMPQVFPDQKDSGSRASEDVRRRAQAQTTVAQAPAAAAITPANNAPAEEPAAAPTFDDLRFHKWARYVIVAKKHFAGEDTVEQPAYIDTVIDGYAKAKAIAVRDNQRVPLIINGGGGPYIENVTFDCPLVDLFGWGNPTIEGHCTLSPDVTTFLAEGIAWRSIGGRPAFLCPPATNPTPQLQPNEWVQFNRCDFYGLQQAFYAQRRVVMDGCRFWFERLPSGDFINPSLELAPCIIEQEIQPQAWWSILKDCKFYAGLYGSVPDTTYIPVHTAGYAIRVQAGLMGGTAVYPNLISNDGVFRTNSGSFGARGALQTGVFLDHCEIYGSARVRDWTLAHQHCTTYGGVLFEGQPGGIYAYISGHDWMGSAGFEGRQFGIVLFDGCNVHSNEAIAVGIRDPNTANELFPGGVAVFFRHSQQSNRFDGAVGGGSATFANGTAKMDVNTCMSSTPRLLWGSGPGINLTDTGSHTSVAQNWHPLFA